MARTRGKAMKVLLAGSSAMYQSEAGPELAVPQLVRDILTSRAPELDWQCEAALLYPTASMNNRAATLIERYQPDAIVLWLTSVQFGEDSVVYAIRSRWPWGYPVGLRVAVSGRPLDSKASLRGRARNASANRHRCHA